jgi:hypothetical protein
VPDVPGQRIVNSIGRGEADVQGVS